MSTDKPQAPVKVKELTREEKAAKSLNAFKQFWKDLFNPDIKSMPKHIPSRVNSKDKRASYSKRAAKAAEKLKAIEVLADRARDPKKYGGRKMKRVLRIEPNPGFLNKNVKRLQHNVPREF